MALTASDIRSPAGLLALQSLPKVGSRTALGVALGASADHKLNLLADQRLPEALHEARERLAEHEHAGVRVLSFFDPRYPNRLRQIPDPPPVLFLRGNLDLIGDARLIAVVGTREPTGFGISAATTLTRDLGDAGWGILSGLAKGIDTLAHRSALQAGAPTIAVMGRGLDRIYPAENEELADQILQAGGALLSEQPFGASPSPANLIARDRLQSGLSAAVLIAQSGLRSGTMHTARYAAAQGTPIFCPEPRTSEEQSEGLRALLDTPADRLWEKLPAWKAAKALSARLGPQPLARPIAEQGVDQLLDTLDQLLSSDPQSTAQQRWWPELGPPPRLGEKDEIAQDDAQAPLFAVAD